MVASLLRVIVYYGVHLFRITILCISLLHVTSVQVVVYWANTYCSVYEVYAFLLANISQYQPLLVNISQYQPLLDNGLPWPPIHRGVHRDLLYEEQVFLVDFPNFRLYDQYVSLLRTISKWLLDTIIRYQSENFKIGVVWEIAKFSLLQIAIGVNIYASS